VRRRPVPLDELDRHLLTLLQSDAGRTLRDLGDTVGLSPSAVQRRISRYRRDGVLDRQVAVLDPRALGGVVVAVVLVTLDRESATHHREFRDRVLGEPRVQQCYDVSGPWDYVVVLTATDLAESRELSALLFRDDENVKRYDTLLVHDAVKIGLTLPLSGTGTDSR